MMKLHLLLIALTIGLSAFTQTINLEEIHTINGKHKRIKELYISKSRGYLVILSEYKYVTFYNYKDWKFVGDFESDKFISMEKCGFSDNDIFFYVRYGRAYQHRQKIAIKGLSSENFRNYHPKTDFASNRFVYFTKISELEFDNYVFKIKGNSIVIYKKLSNPNTIADKILDNHPPVITITHPNVKRGFKPVLNDDQVAIIGNATDTSGISTVLINGEPVGVDASGSFSKTVLLASGDNSFTITAIDKNQNIATQTFLIERNPNQQGMAIEEKQENNTAVMQSGDYYALIIGNNDYQDPVINSLDEPINDASSLYNVLISEYTFKSQNVTFLKNATYVQMIEAFDNLSNTITEIDNLLVFYAGHGWWDDDKELGYWLPTDARQNSTAFWIANSRISDYMSSIDAKHTLLIADACFSGSIFKTRAAFADAGQAINALYALPSRTAMTSGNLKEVPDKSVFLEYLVKRLDNNTEKYLSADQLFVKFRIAVMNNSQTEPQFGTIQNAGDEGGEFIFIRR